MRRAHTQRDHVTAARLLLLRAVAEMVAGLLLVSLAVDVFAQTRGAAPRAQRHVTFNGGALDASGWRVLEQLEKLGGARLPDGAYWYDAGSGVAGRWGGPAAVLLIPGLPLGGRLPALSIHSRRNCDTSFAIEQTARRGGGPER